MLLQFCSVQINRLPLVLALTLSITFWVCPTNAYAQSGSDQAIFQEEQQLLNTTEEQTHELEKEKQNYEAQVQINDQQEQPYRLYAEKRVQELTKLKVAGGSPVRSLSSQKGNELYALEHWLQADAAARAEEQARIKQLDQSIANLQQNQAATLNNMHSDIQGLREDSTQRLADQKFQQQMEINNFNELQSEMGAASWGRPPQDGTFNSVGGYGFGGGYGYGYGSGRRMRGYGW